MFLAVFYTLAIVFALCALIALIILVVAWRFQYLNLERLVPNCKLYLGKVSHCRLKGGAMHSFEYPIFFSYIDLEEIEKIGYSMWPIFQVDCKTSFCSLEGKEHLKEWRVEDKSLHDRTKSYLDSKELSSSGKIRLLSHLTYFGYCFNPVSFFYVFDENDGGKIESVVAEVSNTPWIEQHPYPLHESIERVKINRKGVPPEDVFDATWYKAFHVSPFMEMDYIYNFQFGPPREKLWVRAQMRKESTNEVWFSAHFELSSIDFNPLNLLYVLLWYPLHTRVIQVWIHWEAVKLWLKGVPVFAHPNGTDVDFGFGLTGSRIASVLWSVIGPFYTLASYLSLGDRKVKAG